MQFAFKHMDRSEAVEDAARETIEGAFSKLAQQPTSVNVTFSVNSKFMSVHLSAHLPDGHQIELEQGEDDLYKSIELMGQKLERELVKHKNKILGRRSKGTPPPPPEE